MVDLSFVLEVLSGASTIAVILGIPFIYLQMRQNARLVEAANRRSELVARQNRAQVLLNLAEQMTDRAFVLQRKAVRDIVAKYDQQGWDSFVNSVDGFEVLSFAIKYESAALMAKLELIEESALLEILGFLVAIDWMALTPAIRAFEKMWGSMTFPNFRLLALHAETYWKDRGALIPQPESLFARSGPAGA